MLPKSRRLSHKDFLTAKSHGKIYRTPHFSAVVHLTSPQPSRFAIVTSSKLHKHAVVRNRLRRRIYEILRAKHYALSADLIIFPHQSMLNLSHEELVLALDSFLSKIS